MDLKRNLILFRVRLIRAARNVLIGMDSKNVPDKIRIEEAEVSLEGFQETISELL